MKKVAKAWFVTFAFVFLFILALFFAGGFGAGQTPLETMQVMLLPGRRLVIFLILVLLPGWMAFMVAAAIYQSEKSKVTRTIKGI